MGNDHSLSLQGVEVDDQRDRYEVLCFVQPLPVQVLASLSAAALELVWELELVSGQALALLE